MQTKITSSSIGAVTLAIVIGGLCALTMGQNGDAQSDPERQHALEVYKAFRLVEAMPLLEDLAAKYPKDPVVMESWGVSVVAYAQTLADAEQQKKARVRARKILVAAQALGDNSPLLVTMLTNLPEDGAMPTFSQRGEVDTAMKAAEADFVRGDMGKAREGYFRVLLLDPKNYEAALFTGDTYFKQANYTSAGLWFANAIKIDPNRETAYRYWGDSLTAEGKPEEARSKFVDAVIAEPYNRATWQGLAQWAQRNKVTLNFLRLEDRAFVDERPDGTTEIKIDQTSSDTKNDANGSAWLAYAGCRASWRREKFKKEFPDSPQYRHSLLEESECLQIMVASFRENGDRNKIINPSLLQLGEIDDAKLMDAFVLLNRPDAQIAQDYANYRTANRDKLRSYLDQFVVPLPAARTR